MSDQKEKLYFALILLSCLASLALTYYTFVILPKDNVALGSFF